MISLKKILYEVLNNYSVEVDLFVDPNHRRKKIAEEILLELKKISDKNGWGLIRWITRNDNEKAKGLYDKISEKTTWDTYELK